MGTVINARTQNEQVWTQPKRKSTMITPWCVNLDCGASMTEHVFRNFRKTEKSEADKGCICSEKLACLGMHKSVLWVGTLQLLKSYCPNYFSLAMRKYHDQGYL